MNTKQQLEIINESVKVILGSISDMQRKEGSDQRRLALAKTNIEQGFMWLESAILHN